MSTTTDNRPKQPTQKLISLLRKGGPARIVHLDDEPFMHDIIETILQSHFADYVVIPCTTGDECWAEIARRNPDLLITDYAHPGMRLEMMLPMLRQNSLAFPILLTSAFVSGSAELRERLLSQPTLTITLLNKPFQVEELTDCVVTCLLNSPVQAHASPSKRNTENDDARLPSQTSKWSSRQRGPSECKPLLDAANKDLFRKNAFRITGLSVDATTREVTRHADKLKMLAELGQDQQTQNAAFQITPPPGLDEIRDAIQNLKNPERRLIDEFFWFWPEEFGQSQSDSAIQALTKGDSETASKIWSAKEEHPQEGITAKHNLALIYHISALDWENYAIEHEIDDARQKRITDYWKGASKRWQQLSTDDNFWELVTARIRQLNEPNLPTGFARRMRLTLLDALDKIHAELAVAFAEAGKIELARLHIRFMRDTSQGDGNLEKTAELVLTPARNRLREEIRQAKGRADKNPRDAANAARELLEQARHTLTLFDLFFSKESNQRNDLFDDVASLCNQLPIAYHKATGDDKTCLEILKAVLPFATSMELRQHIEQNISTLSGNLAFKRLEPIYALLKSLQDSTERPSERLQKFNNEIVEVLNNAAAGLQSGSEERGQLFDSVAIVLRGISLDAWNSQRDWTTAVAANELAVKYGTGSEMKQRLAEDKRTLQQMRYEADLTPIASAPSLSTMNGIGFKLYGATDTDQSTGSFLSTYYFVFLFIPVFPICRYRVTQNGDSYRFFGKAPLRTFDKWHLAISIGLIIWFIVFLISSSDSSTPSNPSGYTPPPSTPNASTFTPPAPNAPIYSPPANAGDANPGGKVYSVPSSVSGSLDQEKAQIELDRAALTALDAQIEKLGREIENDRLTLDTTTQSAIDDFNAKVDRYNELVQKNKTATAAFNERVDNYNAKLRQYGQ